MSVGFVCSVRESSKRSDRLQSGQPKECRRWRRQRGSRKAGNQASVPSDWIGSTLLIASRLWSIPSWPRTSVWRRNPRCASNSQISRHVLSNSQSATWCPWSGRSPDPLSRCQSSSDAPLFYSSIIQELRLKVSTDSESPRRWSYSI